MEPDSTNSSSEAVSPHFPAPKRTLPLPEGQPNRKKPVLMQRPQSSGIDVTGFSFARPANQPKGFTLKPIPRLAHHGHASIEEVSAADSQKHTRREKQIPSKSIAEPGQQSLEQYLEERTPCPQPKDHTELAKVSRKGSNMPSAEIASAGNPRNANLANEQVVIDLEPESGTALTTRAIANSSIPSKNTAPRATVSRSAQDRVRKVSATQNPPLPRGPARSKDNLRVSKPRRENRKSALTRQQRSMSSNRSGLHQLTEDTLFEILIGRIRQREENEIAAANIQRRVEAQNSNLKEANDDLHHQLEASRTQLQRKEAEIKKHQARLEDWKVKIRKFKQVVDELGHDHDVLKEDNDRFKVTTASLEKEKNDLFQAVEDTKLQISRAEGAADEQRKELAEKEKRIALLQQALAAAEDQEECTKAELISERNRSTTLESYIQNHALTQAKQIGLIRDDQAKLMQDLHTGLDSISYNAATFKTDIPSEVKAALDQCHASIQTLSEKCSTENLQIQAFTASTRDVVSQIDNLATKLTENVETSNRVNVGMSKSVEDSLYSIESHLGPNSTLSQRLADCDTSYGWLKDKLRAVEPTLANLGASVEIMLTSGSNLVRQFGDFGKRLEEAQIPKDNPELDRQLAEKFAENTQLQLGVQKLSSEVDSLREFASAKDATIEHLQQSLSDAKQKQKASEDRNQVLAIEKTALKGEMELRDQSVRHELAIEHGISQNQMKAQYEQRLQALHAEKNELEKGADIVMTQLSGVQGALVEAKRLVDDQRTLRESMAQETEQRIQQLTQSCSEHMARVDAQTLEIQKYQEAEAASCLERNDLQEQLRQAQEKVHELEQTFVIPAVEEEGPRVPPTNIVPFSTFETRLSPLRATSPYGDPADFAMLFMSDELLLSTPHHKIKEDKESPSRQEDVVEDSQKAVDVPDPTKVFDIPRDMDPPPSRANMKRKAVNFAAHRTDNTGSKKKDVAITRIPSTEIQGSAQAEKETEEQPATVTKHINKWTYSRVHASGIEVQQEQPTQPTRPTQPTVSTRATKGVQRASPKGLVSASSASEPGGRSNTRGRGKRRSRGDRYNARSSQEG
ncbi:uncharacterized protein N7496_003009 [Penicillium cataractarum]|uniref:Uncharacterized protein n=1 Tax=Penicillium cataractarum TaxID=2100454 RepID=A0A9W9SL64_9EURO|nr:uncharacterized protein N7496_003009 [Penicillium cataractarum]KAJ5380581.1 hypothetical protein N7496_003009 [Penicillium cataractarum]